MALSLGCALLASAPAHAQIEEKKFNVIGTWNFINMWKKSEFPFWSEQISKDSGGKVTANIKSITEVNLKGTELLRLLKTGVYDIVAALPIYVDDGGAVIEASDISGLASSPAEAKMGQKAAAYQTTPKGKQRCDNCALWRAPDSCLLVESPISPSGWCNLYRAK